MIGKLTRTIVRTFAFALALCATSGTWAAVKPLAVWNGDFVDGAERGGFTFGKNGNEISGGKVTIKSDADGGITFDTDTAYQTTHFSAVIGFENVSAPSSGKYGALVTAKCTTATRKANQAGVYINSSAAVGGTWQDTIAWSEAATGRGTVSGTYPTGDARHYLVYYCNHLTSNGQATNSGGGTFAYVDKSTTANYSYGGLRGSGIDYQGYTIGGWRGGKDYQLTGARVVYVALFPGIASANDSELRAWSLTDMTKTAATFAGSDANTGVNVPASGETISAATAAAAVFVQADATLGFSGSGSLTIGDGTGPLYIDSAATLTIDLNGVTAPTAESPFVLLVKGQVYGAAQVNFTNVPSDVITSIGEGGTIALLHNSVYTDLLTSWKSNGQKVFAWRGATGNAFKSCNVSSVDTDTGTIEEATATTDSYSKKGGFNDENPAGVLYYDNPAYASSTSVNYSWFTLGGLFVTAGGSSLYNADQQLKLGDNRSNSGKTFHYVFAQSFDLGPFKNDSKLYGPVDLTIYEGATVTLSANGLKLAKDSGMVANLKMSGGGVLKTSGTITAESGSNGITLDYSALDVSRTEPFIQGNLSIDDNVNLVLPAALAANTPYQLCSGTLTVGSTSLQKSITVGSNTFLADLTFDTSAKTVSYCPVRTKTVSGGTTEWSSPTWANGTGTAGWVSGANAYITVSAESTISVGSATTVNKLKLLGSANLTITGIDNLTVGSFDLSEYSGSMVVDGLEAGSIKLNISEDATLTLNANAVISEVTGSGTLEIAAGRTVTLTSNTALDGIASLTGTGTLILPEGAIPSTSGLTALLSNANWRGTLVVSSITGDVERDFATWGNSNSNIKMVGVEGKTKTSNVAAERTVAAGVVLDNGDGDFALKFTSILSGNQSTWTKISGSGTIVLEGDDQQVFEIRDSSGFTGSVSQQANAGRLSFVNNKGSGFKAGKGMITVYDDNNTKAYIGSGATWTAGNKGIQILGTLVIKGDAILDSISDSAKIIIVNNAKLQYDSLGTLTLSNAVQVVQSLDNNLYTSGIGTVKIAFGEDATLFDGAKLIDWSAASLAEPPDGTFVFDGTTPAYKEDNGTYYVLTKDATGLFVREAVAVATKGGVWTYHATVADAIKAAGNDGLGAVIIIKSTTENIVYDKTKVTLSRLSTDITTGTIDPGPEYNAVPGTAQSLNSYPYTYTNKATTYYWTDAGENDSAWSTPGNWAVNAENGPTATRAPTSIDSVVFNNDANVTHSASVTVAGITVNGAVSVGGVSSLETAGPIMGSGTLTIADGTGLASVAPGVTVAPYVVFEDGTYIGCGTGGDAITFNGDVSLPAGEVKFWNAAHSFAGTTTLNGNFTKGGNQTLSLADVNVAASSTLSGAITITGNVTIDSGKSLGIPSSGVTYSGARFVGAGSVSFASAPVSALTFGEWTGTVVIPAHTTNTALDLNYYGVSGSTVEISGMSDGWLTPPSSGTVVINPNLRLTGNMVLDDMSARDYSFQTISGMGSFSVTSTVLTSMSIAKIGAGYEGTISNTSGNTLTITAVDMATVPAVGDRLLKVSGDHITISGVTVNGTPTPLKWKRKKVGGVDGFYVVSGTIFSVY